MKKLLVFLLFFTCTIIVLSHQVKAIQEIPKGINYLSLSNLQLRSGYDLEADTIEPIEIIPNQTYTIVFSYDFLGIHASYIDYLNISVVDFPSNVVQVYPLINDFPNQRAYIEWTSPSNNIHLKTIPIDPVAYEAMMYQGTYADFVSFVPYYHQIESFEYFGTLPIDYDNPWDVTMIQSLISAKDPYGQSLDVTLIQDDYSPSTKRPGNYQMTFQTMYADIVKYYYLDVNVYDIQAPLMTINQTIEIPLTEKVDVSSIVSLIEISDNVDTLDTSQITIIEDTYTPAEAVGGYHIKVQISDLSSNTSILDIPITVVDRNAPTVYFPEAIYLYTSDTPITHEAILSKMDIEDDVDGSNYTTSWVVDQYMQTQVPGKYQMRLSVKDSQLNERIVTLYVHVIENKGPIFENDEVILSTTTHQAMTHQDIIDWFYDQASSQGLSVSNVSMLYNEYEHHEEVEGEYYVYMQYDLQGEQMVSRILMQVDGVKPVTSWLIYAIPTALIVVGITVFIIKKKKA